MAKDPLKELTPDKEPARDKRAPRARRGSKGQTIPQIREGVASFIAMVGVGVGMTGDETCSFAILQGAPALSDSLVELAKSDPKVKKALGALTRTSTWGAVFVAAASIAIPVMAHHGLIPRNLAGFVGGPLDAVDLDSGRARDADRPNGPGQDDPSEGHPATADVFPGPSVQA